MNNAVLHAFAGRAQGQMRLAATQADDGATLRLQFSDDGAGMPPEVLRHVFDPFFTTALGKGGSGLGMSICYNLITGPLGGSIDVASEPGQGSCFTIVLPCVAP